MIRWLRTATQLAAMLGALGCLTEPASAQLVPNDDWRTLRTAHFHVHFTPDVEEIARRAAAVAESAYVALSAELRPPRGPIDLVVADNVDFSNGYATPFPTNRIVIYARPPVDVQSLRFYDDWTTIVVTHELAHIFHLDRARGLWGAAQRVVGRNPGVMPNLYLPSWVKEGIAVYYETRLTGSGRLAASQNPMLARAVASGGHLPTLGELSLTSPTFLGGEIAYAFGALAFDQVQRTQGDSAVPRFVEATSRGILPFRLDAAARRGFGAPLSGIWDTWRDSVRGATVAAGPPLRAWRELTLSGWAVHAPRWTDGGTLIYSANTGRRVPGVYTVDPDGVGERRIGRRNSLEPNVPLADGGILFAQLDFVDAFTVRSDLWRQDGRRERRLTSGARLARPDVRADGAIVAVQGLAGATRLVRLDSAGRFIAVLTDASADVHWMEPRWSPDGRSIAAVRWGRGGLTEIVVLDTAGRVRHTLARDRALNQSPSWAADGASVFYSSDRDGRMQLWRAWLPAPEGSSAPGDPADVVRQRLSDAATGLFFPEASAERDELAAVYLRADGYHLGVAPLPAAAAGGMDSQADAQPTPTLDPARGGPVVSIGSSVAESDTSSARGYSPWRLLVPRYWTPVARQGAGGGLSIGALTSAEDVVGRHAWTAQGSVEPGTRLVDGDIVWRYGGFGMPLVDVVAAQYWDREQVAFSDGEIGTLDERTGRAFAGVTFVRPRFRTSSSLSAGVELESRQLVPRSARVDDALRDEFRGARLTQGVRLAGRWSNIQVPSLAISAEDGLTTGITLRQRWLAGERSGITRSAIGTLAGYRAIPVGGFANHVIAARVAGGWQDARATSSFGAGGVDGGALDVLPGIPLGGGARPFGVRGFAPNAQQGTMATAATVEWRAPLRLVGRGIGRLPLFLDRTAVAAFGDVASAWCTEADPAVFACRGAAARPSWLAATGAELVVDAAPIYDLAYRFRAGIAVPIRTASTIGTSAVSVYLTVGRSF